MTPAQLDALNVAASHEQAMATGRSMGSVFSEMLGGLPSSREETEAWADRAETILKEAGRNGGGH